MRASLRCMSEPKAPFSVSTLGGDAVLPALKPYELTLDGTLGIQITEASPTRVVAVTEIDDRHHQPFGLVHGGLYAVVGESTASVGGALTAIPAGGSAVGLSNNTAFLRPFVGKGRLTSTASQLHGGRSTQVWDVEHVGPDGKLCATSRVTIALRYPEAAPAAS